MDVAIFIAIKSLSSFAVTSIAIKKNDTAFERNRWFCPPSVIHSIYFKGKEKLCHNILMNVDDVNVPWTVSMFPSIAYKNQLKIVAKLNNQLRLHFESVRQKSDSNAHLVHFQRLDPTRIKRDLWK